MRRGVVFVSALLILAGINVSIYRKEQLLEHGRIVLLELAPIDPRSLMQGDYMALRFKAADQAFGDDAGEMVDGRLVFSVDERNIGTFVRIDDGAPLSSSEILLRYRIRDGRPKFATNAFFFQEGRAEDYTPARYGEFRIADDGDCVLTGLRNVTLKRLGG